MWGSLMVASPWIAIAEASFGRLIGSALHKAAELRKLMSYNHHHIRIKRKSYGRPPLSGSREHCVLRRWDLQVFIDALSGTHAPHEGALSSRKVTESAKHVLRHSSNQHRTPRPTRPSPWSS